MNAERLKQIVTFLLSEEGKSNIQGKFNEFSGALNNLANEPQQQNFQTEVAQRLRVLDDTLQDFWSTLTPAQIGLIKQIKAEQFFSPHFINEIKVLISQNAMTPAVVRDRANQITNERQAFLETLKSTEKNLVTLGVEADGLAAGNAEIGILFPRDLFKNQFDQLIKELSVINRVIRAFSELTTGSAEPIEVRQISTSDPIFFFGLSVGTIAVLAKAVNWAVNTWKTVEEIRKLRADARKTGSYTDDEIRNFFDTKIDATVNDLVQKKAEELLKQSVTQQPSRQNEQLTDLTWALKSILARVERGMTVEIRFIPPPTKELIEGEQVQAQEDQKGFEVLKEVTPQLVFPPVEGAPILQLPPAEPPRT